MKTAVVALLFSALLALPALADPQGTVAGLVNAVSYPFDANGTCAVGLETIGTPHQQYTVYIPKRISLAGCAGVFAGDLVVIHFRLEPALCGPDLCANLWATARPEKNL